MSGRVARFVRAVRQHHHRRASGLDFGCGSGEITAALARDGFAMLGVDISEAMIRAARADTSGAHFEQLPEPCDLRRWWGARDRAAFVIASSVLEYVPDVDRTLRDLRSVVAVGGTLFATVPSASLGRALERHAGRGARRLVRTGIHSGLPARARSYVEYLALSRNRHAIGTWARIGVRHGFELVEVEGEREALMMLVLRAT